MTAGGKRRACVRLGGTVAALKPRFSNPKTVITKTLLQLG